MGYNKHRKTADIPCPQDPVADGYLSDESSFYGDEETIITLERAVSLFNPLTYWKTTHPTSLSTIAAMQRDEDEDANKMDIDPKNEQDSLDNAPPGCTQTRQPTETIPQFLARLPPSTTRQSDVGPWIWIRNPTAPLTTGTKEGITNLQQRGAELLQAFAARVSLLEAQYKNQPRTQLIRKINIERRKLDADILQTARGNGILSGKWMFFPSVRQVDRVWAIVAEATAKGDLGIGAKVAPDPGFGDGDVDDDDSQQRLICVHTADFADREDIRRVLVGLKELRLVRVGMGEGPVYYKSDAYTWLNVYRGNSYGLKPSMYSSTEVLGRKW
ncbi:hypothetical protein FQN50_007083 [Emmonsiellopsis sp. PD_5]|nr:hypothetical protein FQN50_007083 [Emmonsiellopsis sp. PD_5]